MQVEIIGPLGFLPSSSKSTFPRNSKALLFGRSPSLRLLCSNLLKEEGEEKNRLGDALCLNIWPVHEHFEWLVCSVSLQVPREGDSSIVERHKRSCACPAPGILFKCQPLRKSNSGSGKKEICTNPPHWSANKLANTCNRSALQAGLPAIYCRLFSKPFDTGFILHRGGLWACETTKCHLVRLLRFLPQIRWGLCCYKARTSLVVRLWNS